MPKSPINFAFPGRMISGSKSGYLMDNKGHVVVFNANLCIKSTGKVWYGDLDLNKDSKDLVGYCLKLGEDIYVLREMDARFDKERNPLYENAVAKVTPAGVEILGH